MYSKKTITPGQCRAARAVLEWSQEQLATEAGVNRMTVADFEQGKRSPMLNNLVMIRRAFEQQGVTFIDENGGPPGLREPRRVQVATPSDSVDETKTGLKTPPKGGRRAAPRKPSGA